MFRSLKSNRDGNVAMIFAICLIPLMVLMGAAIDMSRQRGNSVAAQNAIDAALLAVAHEAFGMKEEDIQGKARKWFTNQLNGAPVTIEQFVIVKGDRKLTADVTVSMDTTFLSIMGIKKLRFTRHASVLFGIKKVEMALVLDTTGSMLQKPTGSHLNKLKIMQKAATDMMTQLEDLPNSAGQIEVAIVPFATYVNVGKENAKAKWMDTKALSSVHGDNLVDGLNRFDLYDHLGYEWKGCVQARPAPYDVDDTTPRKNKPDTLYVPLFHPDETDSRWREQFPNNYVSDASSLGSAFLDIGNPMKYGLPENVLKLMDGYVYASDYDRDDCEGSEDDNEGYGNNDCEFGDPLKVSNWTTVETKPTYTYFSDVFSSTGPSYNCEMRPITPLTSRFSDLRKEIDALSASGSTNLAQGMVWGWRALSPEEPFSEGDAFTDEVEKVVVLLSDGNNMVVERNKAGGSDFSAYGYLENERLEGTTSRSTQKDILDAMDERTLTSCANAKEAGIRIITIRLDLADERSEKVLKTCASSPDDYLDVQDGSKLGDAFKQITEKVTLLYLSE
ncbi:pilus assembly protein TadG-related protein [Ponticaulis profundi]|uniref:Pilus assembly protein TadG-related protein n=1 Tax=Ponticaulis profundi TaxID=2665222 RepID=A0ABW1S6Z9_9PROT